MFADFIRKVGGMISWFGCSFCWEVSQFFFFFPKHAKAMLLGRRETDFTLHMKSQQGADKADRCGCPLYLLKTINPHPSLPQWLLFGPLSGSSAGRQKDEGGKMWKDAAGLFGHFTNRCIFFSCDPQGAAYHLPTTRKHCSLCHNKEHNTENKVRAGLPHTVPGHMFWPLHSVQIASGFVMYKNSEYVPPRVFYLPD